MAEVVSLQQLVEGQATFTIELEDGRIAHCWQAKDQPYQDCVFSAGLVAGLGVDTIYFKVQREGDSEPYILFLRPDEAQAIAFVVSGALWSQQTIEMDLEDAR